jgi:hypothetical protein
VRKLHPNDRSSKRDRSGGRGPVRELELTSSKFKDTIVANSLGTWMGEICCNRDSDPISGGMTPVKQFISRDRKSNRVRNPIDEGIT